jgi:signal transduction histidine kinase
MGLRGPLTDVQTIDVRRIASAYRHLAKLVDDLLSYNRIVSGHLPVETEDVAIAHAIAGLFDMIAPAAAAKLVHVEFDQVEPALIARGDAERIRQIVLNLLGNAVKFTEARGSVRLRCAACGDHVEVEISDTGVGIPQDRIDVVFEPFTRLRNGLDAPGTGLGLSISRGLARAMGGDVVVTSTPGVGSRFVLRLPRSTPLASSKETG